MGVQSSKLQIIKESIYPNIYKNKEKFPYTIVNNSKSMNIQLSQRIFFNSRDSQGNIIDPQVINTNFSRGVFCPQGFRTIMLHIGYTLVNKLDIREPQVPNEQYTNKQILKLTHPFVLGMVIQDIGNFNEYFYIKADQFQDQLLNAIIQSKKLGDIRNIYSFTGSIWKQGRLNNQLLQSNTVLQLNSFQDQACFHTMIPVSPNKSMVLFNNNKYGLKEFTQQQQINSSLIGVVYLKATDIEPVFIYGYDYDLLVFQKQISLLTTDIFYYSAKSMKLTNQAQYFKDYIIQLIQLAFAEPREIKQISDSVYLQIQIQISNLLSGNVTIYGNNLNGQIDSLVADICKLPQYQGSAACSCLNLKVGTACGKDPLNVRCRDQGYKTLQQLTQPCDFTNVVLNYYDTSQNVNLVSASDLQVGNLSLTQKQTSQK